MTYIPLPNPLPVVATGIVAATQATSPWVTTATVQGTVPVTGVVSATQGTSPWAVSLAAVAATQGTSPWVTTATVQGVVPVTGAVSATQGTSPWVVSAAALGATQGTSPWVTTATVQGTVPVTGAVAATQGTSPWVASGVLGSTQGTSPWVTTATVQGVVAAQGILGATQGTSPWVASGVLGSTQGTSPWVVSAAAVGATQGTSPWVVSAAAVGATQGTSPWVVSAAAVGATQSGNWTARVVGNAGAVLDAVITPATAPANAAAVLSVCSATNNALLTAGQSIALQCDYAGNLFIKPLRRSNIIVNSIAVVNTTTATTMLPAQGAGIYSDLTDLVATVTPAAVTSTVFTLTVSDGTANYIFDMVTGNATSFNSCINLDFNPPIPASVAATTWTAKLSSALVTVHILAAAALGKTS